MTDYVAILSRRYAGKEWWLADNDYATLEWMSDTAKPSKKTLDDLWASVQQEIADEPAAKATARQAVLDRLGITEAEARMLLS